MKPPAHTTLAEPRAMNKLANSAPWYAPWKRRAAAEQDPADLGTAFGLDLSMELPPEPMPVPRGATRATWVPRWVRGRKLPAA